MPEAVRDDALNRDERRDPLARWPGVWGILACMATLGPDERGVTPLAPERHPALRFHT